MIPSPLILTLLLSFYLLSTSSTIIIPLSDSNLTLQTVPLYYSNTPFEFSPFDDVLYRLNNYTGGSMVYLDSPEFDLKFYDLYREVLSIGMPTAMLVHFRYDPGQGGSCYNVDPHFDYTVLDGVPVLQIIDDVVALERTLDEQGSVGVYVESTGVNLWYEARISGWLVFMQVLLVSFSLVNIVSIVYRVSVFCFYGIPMKMASYVLLLEVIANLIRGIYIGVDPFWSRRIFSNTIHHLLITITYPISTTTSLLMILFLHDVLHNTKIQVFSFLGNSLSVFLIVSLLNAAVEITASIFRSLPGAPYLFTTLSAGLFSLTSLFLVIFYSFYSFKILKRIKLLYGKKAESVEKISVRLFLSGLGTLVIMVSFGLALTPLYNHPTGFFIILSSGYMALNTISALQINACIPSEEQKQDSKRTNSKPSKTKGSLEEGNA
eukprot:TRINITY_DN2880_c0_g1_i1.p1 TRINITY_DN2880_c0_g1~~TRINITY_DN2880_c0_g1_i1.p1  ORF type:complete len:448 (-),score=57.08 TRINITY_DN2880_c0_g1_i1:200-1501(-)